MTAVGWFASALAVGEAEVAADIAQMEKARFATTVGVEGLGSEIEAEQSFDLEIE